MRTLAALAACLALAAPAWAQDSAPNPIQALDDCVSAQARRLEISGEAADIVAQAAVAKCARELTAAVQSPGMFRSGGVSREELKASMRDSALVDIVELRATRHTPLPAPPPKPARGKKR